MANVLFLTLGALVFLVGLLLVGGGVYATVRASGHREAKLLGNHVTVVSREGGVILAVAGVFFLLLVMLSIQRFI